jgi:hypothetical protein
VIAYVQHKSTKFAIALVAPTELSDLLITHWQSFIIHAALNFASSDNLPCAEFSRNHILLRRNLILLKVPHPFLERKASYLHRGDLQLFRAAIGVPEGRHISEYTLGGMENSVQNEV